MAEGWVFAIVFAGFFILRAIAATVFFLALLPDDDRCLNCNDPTLRIRSRGWNFLLPGFRTSWCPRCGWEGLLRSSPRHQSAAANSRSQSGQTPLSSKKSS
jgi:hypothetical protein